MTDQHRHVMELVAQGQLLIDSAEQVLDGDELCGPCAHCAGATATGEMSFSACTCSPRAALACPHERDHTNRHDADRGYLRIVFEQACENASPQRFHMRLPIEMLARGVRLGALLPAALGKRLEQALEARGIYLDVPVTDRHGRAARARSLQMDITIDLANPPGRVRIFSEGPDG